MYKNVMLCTFNSLDLIFGHFHIQMPMKLMLEPQFKLQGHRRSVYHHLNLHWSLPDNLTFLLFTFD